MAVAAHADYYTVAEAARELGVSPSTVWRWINANKLPALRIGARKIRIRKEDLPTMVNSARPTAPLDPSKIKKPSVFEPPTAEQLDERRAATERILARRPYLSIAPLTTAELVEQVRKERQERHETWVGVRR